jgi:sortase (surface protein transpeptidase)
VTEKFVTEGLDMSILEDVKDKQLVTIFCCSYQVNNGRLVVRGELETIHYN